MRHIKLVCICRTSVSESSSVRPVSRPARAHTHAYVCARTHARDRASRERGGRGEHGRTRGGWRASTSRRPVAFGSDAEGWSREERRAEPGGQRGKYHPNRRAGRGGGRLRSMSLICRRPRHRRARVRLAADGVTEPTPPGSVLPSDVAGVGAACARF